MDLKAFDGLIAEEFQAVATFDQRDAFGCQALEFDRLHLRAVLLALALALRLFVVVELASDAVGGTMEEIDGRPKQVLQVRLEPGVVQGGDEGVEDIGHGASDHLTFGHRSGIGLVVEGTIAKELQFAQHVLGRRYAVRWLDVVMVAHEESPLPVRPRPSRPSWRSRRRRAGRARTRKRQRRAEAPAEDGRGAAILLRDAKRAIASYIM